MMSLNNVSVFIRVVASVLRDFAICHDDFELKPPDGTLSPYTFKWLGFVYYVHGTYNFVTT